LESLKSPPGAPLEGASSGRAWLYVAIGFCVALLCVGAAIVALQFGKGGANRGESPATNPEGSKVGFDQLGPNDLVPGVTDILVTPKEAPGKDGAVHTVDFKVHSVDGTGTLNLHSEPDPMPGEELTVRISAAYFTAAGSQTRALWEQTKKEFEGKHIRARGKLLRDPPTKGLVLDVRIPKQIVVVVDR
jgi:hypothetical protein